MLIQLERPGQPNREFGDTGDQSSLRLIGQYHEAADLVLGHFFDRLQIKGPSLPLLRLLVIARILCLNTK